VGVYLYGSLATQDFDPNGSDIDLLIVLNDAIELGQLPMLEALHDNFKASHHEWQNRLDVAYISRESLSEFKTKTYSLVVSSGGEPLAIRQAPAYYLIDWYKVQEHGVPIDGPAVVSIMPHITREEFVETIRGYMYMLSKHVDEATNQGYQAYLVLTMCRSFYACVNGEPVSKKAGAQWFTDKYPQWLGLVDKAIDWSRDATADVTKDKNNQKEMISFVNFILSEVESIYST
jgi:hypothetical protein